MILRDRCSTSYDLASLFRSRRSTSETWTWTGKNSKRVGVRQLCTQLSIVLEETRSHTLEMIQIFILSFFCVFSYFFCHFNFVCHLFCHFFVVSVLSVFFFVVFRFWPVVFLWSFGGKFVICFCHFLAMFVRFSQKY